MAFPRRRGVLAAELGTRSQLDADVQRRWLMSSRSWGDLGAPKFVPVKVLGAGGQGVCGLWRRTSGRQPRYVVVKQAHYSEKKSIRNESRLLHRILEASLPTGGANHVVKLYKPFHRAPGLGLTSADDVLDFDPSPYDEAGVYQARLAVARIYLEYCEGGDLWSLYIGKLGAPVLAEEELWRMLGCFARAALAMEIGSEVDGDARNEPAFEPIAHFDIKPANILVDDVHPRCPNHQILHSFKIADFGLALPVLPTFNATPPDFNSNADWNKATEWRGTPGWPTVEQLRTSDPRTRSDAHPLRQIGHRSNTFSIGLVMYWLMTQGKVLLRQSRPPDFDADYPEWEYTFSTFWAWTPGITQMSGSFEALGLDLHSTAYSKSLLAIVHRCLAFLPTERISPQDLLSHVDQTLADIDEIRTAAGIDGRIDFGSEAFDLDLEEDFPSLTRGDRKAMKGAKRATYGPWRHPHIHDDAPELEVPQMNGDPSPFVFPPTVQQLPPPRRQPQRTQRGMRTFAIYPK